MIQLIDILNIQINKLQAILKLTTCEYISLLPELIYCTFKDLSAWLHFHSLYSALIYLLGQGAL